MGDYPYWPCIIMTRACCPGSCRTWPSRCWRPSSSSSSSRPTTCTCREFKSSNVIDDAEEESALVNGSYDIFMTNHYASRAITDCDSEASNTPSSSLLPGYPANKGVDDSHVMPGTHAGVPDRFGNNYCKMFTGYPPGYLDMIRHLHAQDTRVDILLAENGLCGNDDVDNMDQIWYFKAFVEQVHKAVVDEKFPVIGYTAWSFLDNYEWGSYGPRFGMYYVNFTENTGAEYFYEPSAKWFHKVATTKCLDGWSEIDAKAATASHKSETSILGVVFGFVALATVVSGVVVVFVSRHRRSGYEPIVSRN